MKNASNIDNNAKKNFNIRPRLTKLTRLHVIYLNVKTAVFYTHKYYLDYILAIPDEKLAEI